MEPSAIELVLNPSATSFRAVAMGVDISLPCTVFFFFTPPTPTHPNPIIQDPYLHLLLHLDADSGLG